MTKLGFSRKGDDDGNDGRRCTPDAVIDLAAKHGFEFTTKFGSELLVRRAKDNALPKIRGKWLVIADGDDVGSLPCTVRSEVLVAVYLHCAAVDGPAFAGGECGGDGPESEHYYPNLPAALWAIDQLLGSPDALREIDRLLEK